MNYFEKLEKNPYEDLLWNIPEQKQGAVNVVGGVMGNFRTEVRVAEFLANGYPVKDLRVVLPDALQGKIPVLPNLVFAKSTDSGSFADGEELAKVLETANFNLLLGDFSKNTTTGRAIASACENSERPLLITRDGVDLIAENMREVLLANENLIFFASVAQLAKLLRSVYYPKMLLMSASLVQVAEVLHKFTLSYPARIVTLHNGQILVAFNGTVKAVPLELTGLTPISFWRGELAAKIVALNLYNPHNFVKASVCALFA